jgi:HEAT repeat protein
MLKKFFIAAITLFTGILSTRLSLWITRDPKLPLLSFKQLLVTVACLLVLLALLWTLETQKAVTFNWPWHRFWFFRDLLGLGKAQAKRLLAAPETPAKASVIDVIVNGRRENLVSLLLKRFKNDKGHGRILILGDPGSGKTTTLEELRLNLARDGVNRLAIGKRIPIMLRLGNYNQGKILDHAREVMARGSRASVILSTCLERLLRKGHAILLLDAIDESLGQNQNALREIETFLTNDEFKNAAVLISGRRGEYQRALPADVEVLEIEDLSDEAVVTFCRVQLKKANRAQSPSEVFSTLKTHGLLDPGGLGRNPFWLQLILQGGTFENNKSKIFDGAISALLKREWDKGGSKRLWARPLTQEEQLFETLEALTSLAHELSVRNQGEQIDGEEALTIVSQYLSRRTGIEKLRPQDVLWLARDAQLIDFQSLTGKNKWQPVRFRHRLIREYLTARALSKSHASVLQAFADHTEETHWWETLLMLTSLLDDEFAFQESAKLITMAIGDGRNPHRLFFAAAMLRSIDFLHSSIHASTIDSLVANLGTGLTTAHVEAALALGHVAPSKLVNLLNQLIERNDPTLTAIVKDLVQQLLQREVTDSTSSRVIASFIGDINVRTIANPILVSIGAPATPLVVEALNDSDFVARWSAAEVLGDIRDQRAVEPLIATLNDPRQTVRRTAIEALGKIGDVRALIPIAKVLQLKNADGLDFLMNSVIIRALGNIGEPAIDELIRMLKMDDVTLRIFATMSLEQIGQPATNALIATLDYPATWTRQAAVELLGSMKAVEATDPLIKLMTCGDLLVEETAVDALIEIGEPAVAPLIPRLGDRNLEMRIKAAQTLGKIRDQRAIEPLLRVLKDRGEENDRKRKEEATVRAAAAEALGNIGDRRVEGALREAIKQDRFLIQIMATVALAQFGDNDALDTIHSLINHEMVFVQASVVESLGTIKNSKSLPYLERFLKVRQVDPAATPENNKTVEQARDLAFRSIEQIATALMGPQEPPTKEESAGDLETEQETKEPDRKELRLALYAKLLVHENPSVRADTASALAELGPPSADLLMSVLTDAEPKVRQAAAAGLGSTGSRQAVQPLVEILQRDQKNVVRRAAAESLGEIGDSAAIAPLRMAIADEYLIVRIGAAIGLSKLGEAGMIEVLRGVLRADDSPSMRFLVARAFLEVKDVTAVPELEALLARWQKEGVLAEDALKFKGASKALEELKALR